LLKAQENVRFIVNIILDSVRGTVRDKDDEEIVTLLKEAFGDLYDKLELVSADLNDRDSIIEASEGCTYIMHTCSPFPFESPSDGEGEVIKPAVNGVKYILNAAVKHKVKKVVLTSSCLTIYDPMKGAGDYDETSFTEENDQMNPYYISKIRSERFAFDFIDTLPESELTFSMCTVHPGFITGPTLMSRARGYSLVAMLDCLNNTMKADAPQLYVPHIDVRDAAKAHVQALEKGNHGERYALNSGTIKAVDLCTVVNDEFGPKGYKTSTGELSYFVVWLASFFNKDAKSLLWQWDIKANVIGDKAAEEFGIEYIKMKESVIDMCNSFIDKGLAKEVKN